MATSTFMGNALVNKVVARTQGPKQVTTCLAKKAAPKAAAGKAVKVRHPRTPWCAAVVRRSCPAESPTAPASPLSRR